MRIAYKHLAAALALAIGLGLYGNTVQAADEPANIIKYRQNVMKAVGARLTNIAAVVKGEVSDKGNIPANAAAIIELLNQAGPLFPEGTHEGKTRALPEIWSEWDKFEAAMKASQEKAVELQAVAGSGDIGQIGQALGNLGKSCGGCHKPYRKEK